MSRKILAFESTIARVSAVLGRLSIAVMFIIIIAEVSLREGFDTSIHLSDELGGYLLVALAFFSLPMTLRSNGSSRAEFVTDHLPSAVNRLLKILFDLICFVFCLILAIQLGHLSYRSYWGGELSLTQLRIPLWIPQTSMVVGITGLTAAFGLQFVRTLLSGTTDQPRETRDY